MNRKSWIAVALLVPALAFVGFTGCSKDNPPAAKDAKKTGGDGKVTGDGGKKAGEKITAATEGTIVGMIKYDGEAPAAKIDPAIENNKDPMQKKDCMSGGKGNALEQTWLIKDGGVANVVIWLAPPEGKSFDPKADLKTKWEKNTATLDQPYCQYIPHNIAVWAEVQPFVVKNSAKFPHNTKIAGGVNNEEMNKTIGSGDKPWNIGVLKLEKKPLSISCQMHNWMSGKLFTFEHPYFAVTKDGGSFEISDVPVGEEYRVMAWHDSFEKAKELGKLSVKKGENKIEYKIK